MTRIKWNKDIKFIAFRTGIMLALLIAASVIGYLFRAMGLPETDIAIVYLLTVLLTARFTHGYIFGFLASLFSTFAFNFFFTEPYFSFAVKTPSYIITFVIMTITALVTSTLTTHAKQNEIKAREREAETKALYTLTNRLTDASNINDIAGIATGTISEMMHTNVACLCFDENGMPEQTFIQQVSPEKQVRREIPDVNALMHRMEGLRTGYDIGTEFYDWPTSRVKHADAQLGIGLGLAICDAAVKAHGGSIKACNRTDGPGAELTFTLPLEVSNHESI